MDDIKGTFDSANIFEVRADLDTFLLLAAIAEENNPRMLEMADPLKGSKGVYELAEHLITEIKQEMKSRRLN